MDRRTLFGQLAGVTAGAMLGAGGSGRAQAAPLPPILTAEDLFAPKPHPRLAEMRAQQERYGTYWPMIELAATTHVCGCDHCDPRLGDALGWRGEGHYAIRFFDEHLRHPTDQQLLHRYARPLTGGVLVNRATEVIVGNPGTVWIFRCIGEPKESERGVAAFNKGAAHTCYTCIVAACERGQLSKDGNRLHQLVWSDLDQRMVVMNMTPTWGACKAIMRLPNVTMTPMPDARAKWQEEYDHRERRRREEHGW